MLDPNKIPIGSWMTDADTSRVINALTRDGARVRFAGGCVRDALLYREINDVDLATTDRPEQVIALLEAAGIKAVPTGIEHGTVTAVTETRAFEVTTLRRDVATDGRHAKVAFTADWDADAARRDFTINAIYADPDGTLFDPLGGRADLAAHRVRFIGDPAERIKEDALRILRFYRFHAWYGEGPLDAQGLKACVEAKDSLKILSAERITAELFKILSAPEPVAVVRQMLADGVMAAILLEATNIERFANMVTVEEQSLFPKVPVRRLFALLETDVAGLRGIAARLRLSNQDAERLVAMAEPTLRITPTLTVRKIRRTLYHIGAERFVDLVILAWAQAIDQRRDSVWRSMIAIAQSWVPPKMPISGRDVVEAGVPPGEAVGEVLREVEEWWEEADFTPDRYSLIERLKAVAALHH